MKPCRLILPIIVLFFFSCKNHTAVTTAENMAKIAAKDTADNGDEPGYPVKYIEHARMELKDQVITLTSRFAVVNGKVDEENHYDASSNYFVFVNKKIGKADTLEAGLENLGGWSTRATESFRAHRVIAGRIDSSLVEVKASEEVTVDTLYRKLGKVRLHVADSVIVEVKMETARKKLGHNIAG